MIRARLIAAVFIAFAGLAVILHACITDLAPASDGKASPVGAFLMPGETDVLLDRYCYT
ncbi:MAG: hypothetical protein ACI9UA_002929, partial [Pseudoalteromonas tetraodonis]